MKNLVLFIFCLFFITLITNALSLGTEGILNADLTRSYEHTFVAGIFSMRRCCRFRQLIGSGALVASHYVLSAAHHFVDLTSSGTYKLKSKVFYVHLGSRDFYNKDGELVAAETFYFFGYNITTGDKDIALIKVALPHVVGALPWDPVLMARDDMHELTRLEGEVASHGIHNTNHDKDHKLRFALAKIVDDDQCDNILINSSQICIKMYKDDNNSPRGLCKKDGGAPFLIFQPSGYHLVGIAGKPKQNCDDTERGAIYTDVRQLRNDVISIISGNRVASHVLHNNQPIYSLINLFCIIKC